jgi:hypothetical protein
MGIMRKHQQLISNLSTGGCHENAKAHIKVNFTSDKDRKKTDNNNCQNPICQPKN